MPLDCIWVDIDYADGKKYFVWDKKQFPSPHDMLSLVKQHKRRLVTIVDPHVKADESYFLYKIAKQRGLLVKTDEGSDYIAKCWPGDSVWLDFTNPLTTELLTEIYTGFHAEEKEDFIWTDAWVHIWNDMNEPAVFEPTDKTFPKGNLHYGNVEHRDIHNVYGHDNAKATYKALAKRGNMRPFVLTRSFYAGTQQYAAVWSGDGHSSWQHYKLALPMLLSSSICGISFVGADVPGFQKDPLLENGEMDQLLVLRWYQLGCFMPFFRAHSNCDTKRREPYLFPNELRSLVLDLLNIRYSLLPYTYTQFYRAYKGLGPVISPVLHPDGLTFREDQFMFGTSLLVQVLDEKTNSVVKLPQGQTWYHLITHKRVENEFICEGQSQIAVFVKGGTIIPRYKIQPGFQSTEDLRDSQGYFEVYGSQAVGEMYLDDMNTFDYVQGKFILAKFTKESGSGLQISEGERFFREWEVALFV